MKYLIAGLGNIGSEYANTRHNIGFLVLDQMAAQANEPFVTDTLGDLCRIRHKSRTFLLLKPSTYMNRSGKAVHYWLQKEKIPKENLLVVLDDLNLEFGKQRLRGKGSDGGHNGLKDIDQMTGGNQYARLRIGIGRPETKGRQVDYVLGPWNREESEKLPEILLYAIETIKSFGVLGLEQTMNHFNKK
jgi:PTH1 family peptidyl-tRNA hydrolase